MQLIVHLGILIVGCAGNIFAADGHWVTTWGCGPQLTEAANLPPAPLANSTLRQFVHVTLGGKEVRVRFSNAYGTSPVAINSVHAALASGDLGSGNIDPVTDKALTFHGAPSVTILPGAAVFSDSLDYDLPALSNLAISIYFGDISATSINGHPGSRTSSFILGSNVVSVASMKRAKTAAHWYVITGVEVLADDASKAIVTLGDSITDGRGSTTDGNNRWPDDLARRLGTNGTNGTTAGVAVVNMGIGGNGIFGGLGPAAMKRFDRDVLEQSGVRWVIVFEGVNDIGGDRSGTIATNLIAAYMSLASKAHAHGLLAYAGTITPFGRSFYDKRAHEAERETVNAWFRTNQVYDALIDFDAAVRDPVTLTNLSARYDSGDHLHLNPAGYQTMADCINLKLFAP